MNNKNLANLIRPTKLEDIVGQKHVVKLLEKVIANKITTSFIFFGESGTGKTTSAMILANQLGLKYDLFNASVDNKDKLINILKNNDVIIIDEIHRLNKDKQDILLSYLEFDKIIVYATTTENPYFKVVPALRSRMQIVQFFKISEDEIAEKLNQIVKESFPNYLISMDVLKNLARFSSGDLRLSINNLHMLILCSDPGVEITKEQLKQVIPNINFYSDLNSSAHYNNLSAFHKSLRGSDVNAALYYGMLILKSGDVDGLFRRMICASYEDIGHASPNVNLRVLNAIEAFERLGMPEGKLPIAFAIIDIALAPKSNSTYIAIENTEQILDSGQIYQIPKHLRDSHYASAAKLGDGIDYKYPHNYWNNYVNQQYLPKELSKAEFYFAGLNENEQKYKKYWQKIKEAIKED
ncbi:MULTISPECIES: replication-associated recombination protein A [unclassified Mycoplasma]|uniref:replication-associated recombination protein A n=1 Tax=unclassified Mycoplasma TaxID=2683645 RepID=UPI002B1E6843|nr:MULTISPECIES: replication-associated recombination protein A [unclassified Mycoplasma]MEA4190874.1 replication-associated recombination protein A [Mycoplasma sp. 2248]MEA4206164.1 replication-associated recombination protein A [Mycoplasma sp. 1199]